MSAWVIRCVDIEALNRRLSAVTPIAPLQGMGPVGRDVPDGEILCMTMIKGRAAGKSVAALSRLSDEPSAGEKG